MSNQLSSKAGKALAEVVESSLKEFTAQSWQWDLVPPFGSLITVKDKRRTLFGIVYNITTGSMDPLRYPFTYQKTEEELLNEQPQIFAFLKTNFNCLNLGYKEQGKIFYLTSPEPPKIHAFVQEATREEYQEFFSKDRYLHLLFNHASQTGSLDDLLLALLKNLKLLNLLSEEKTVAFLESFSLLTGNDYRHLKLFLQRAHSILR
jgi:hypothetical protein